MDIADVAALAARSTCLFRLETQPTYRVEQETDDLAAWRRGDRTLLTPATNSWLARIRDTTAAGVRWSRVRILDYPLTEYSEFELYGYQANQRAGEHIQVANRAWAAELNAFHQDFWIFDDIAVMMVYDGAGNFVRPEPCVDARPYRAVQTIASRYAIPLSDYLVGYEPRLIA